jgi:hypothetical protein
MGLAGEEEGSKQRMIVVIGMTVNILTKNACSD